MMLRGGCIITSEAVWGVFAFAMKARSNGSSLKSTSISYSLWFLFCTVEGSILLPGSHIGRGSGKGFMGGVWKGFHGKAQHGFLEVFHPQIRCYTELIICQNRSTGVHIYIPVHHLIGRQKQTGFFLAFFFFFTLGVS